MVSGNELKQAIVSGANNIANHKQLVDELNVFPVPDGDTGTNMSMTAQAALSVLKALEKPNAYAVMKATAAAMLRGARGNSGVILSLLFRGIANGLKDKDELNGTDLAFALSEGIDSAYKAVMKPTEGTILTVARLSAEKAAESAKQTNDFLTVFQALVQEAEMALNNTPQQLPVLKKAGVVDAGGKGLLLLYQGMLQVFEGGSVIALKTNKDVLVSTRVNAAAEFDTEITFTYCTEFIVNISHASKDALALRAYLQTIGDSVVVVDDDDIIKVHVHTDNPGNAIQEGLKFGPLTSMKIENMRDQHEHHKHEAKEGKAEKTYVPVNLDIPYGFVAVAAGQGLHNLFNDLGVNKIINGGQTMNPSTESILKAIQSVPAKTVFVLPNNKNIIMAAEQAVALADRRVCVLQSRSIPQGLSAMMAFDPEQSFHKNRVAMTKAIDHVNTGLITFAARNSEYGGHKIKIGDILALNNGKLAFTEKDILKSVYKLAKGLCKKDTKFLTLIYGADVPAQKADDVLGYLRGKFASDIDITLVNGGQPVYYYIISVE